jgi:hypothetical protein
MHVAVLIVAFQHPPDVVRCLRALELSTYQDFEVVVCENGGKQAYDELVAALKASSLPRERVRIIEAPNNGGFASGVNLCFRASPTADLWWILNPDTEPDRGALNAMVARFSMGNCDAVGGTLYLPDGRVQSHGGVWRPLFARPVSIGYGTTLNTSIDQPAVERRLNYLSGASMMVSRKFHATVGNMREDYFLYCEETAWCLEAVRQGMRFGFARDARVLHYQGTSTGNTMDVASRSRLSVYLSERNKILLTKDYFPYSLWLAAPTSFLNLLVRYIRHRAWSQLWYAISGWVAGIRNERGCPNEG